MFIIKLWSGAGATGHVFFLKNGKIINKGLAYSGFVGPRTTIAVVPGVVQTIPFSVDARTSDKQQVIVIGSVTATFVPTEAVRKFDFTVDLFGSYQGEWEQTSNAAVIEKVLNPIWEKAKTLSVEDATKSQKDFGEAIMAALSQDATLVVYGIKIESCSVTKVRASDDAINTAIGATEKESMLTTADTARHTRQIAAAANSRAVREYESATELELEKKRTEIIKEESKNKDLEAAADAKATKTRFEALKDVDSGTLFGASMLEFAKTGKVGTLNITPEILAMFGKQ
jgi:hypothetical protein